MPWRRTNDKAAAEFRSWAPAHNTPVPLERSAPASFKRLLGSPTDALVADEARIDVWLLEPSPQERDDCYDVLPEWRRNPLYCGLELLHNGRKLELIEHGVSVWVDEVDERPFSFRERRG